MQIRPGTMEYKTPAQRGYRIPGAKLKAADPYASAEFEAYIRDSQDGHTPRHKRDRNKDMRRAMRCWDAKRYDHPVRAVRKLLHAWTNQACADADYRLWLNAQ